MKARLKAGEVLLAGTIAEYVRPAMMKFYQQAGFDFVYIEYEHAYFDPPALADTVLAGRDSGLPVTAKTPQLERAEVAKLLECGVVGIQLPRTESREQVQALLSYMNFPPAGDRAMAAGYGNSDYIRPKDIKDRNTVVDDQRVRREKWLTDQDAETTLIAQIETKVGYERAEEIVSTPGVDMLYVGPGDFSIHMGHPGDPEHPEVRGPMEEILELCKKYHVPFGTTASSLEAADRWVSKGAKFFVTADERAFITGGGMRLVNGYRKFLDQPGLFTKH